MHFIYDSLIQFAADVFHDVCCHVDAAVFFKTREARIAVRLAGSEALVVKQ